MAEICEVDDNGDDTYTDLETIVDEKTVFVQCTVCTPEKCQVFFVPIELMDARAPSRIFRFMRKSPNALSTLEESGVLSQMEKLYFTKRQNVAQAIHRRYLLPDDATKDPNYNNFPCNHKSHEFPLVSYCHAILCSQAHYRNFWIPTGIVNDESHPISKFLNVKHLPATERADAIGRLIDDFQMPVRPCLIRFGMHRRFCLQQHLPSHDPTRCAFCESAEMAPELLERFKRSVREENERMERLTAEMGKL